MTRGQGGIGIALLLAAALTAVVTWPLVLNPAGSVLGHHDTYFSMWRVGWIAHALTAQPLRLFDANIFSPTPGTLAYSDATLLQGLVGAPLLWAGLSPALVYNLLLAIGYAGSGVGMFVLSRHLTGQTGPALIAAAAFTLAPYRTEHVMHLELQWAMWIPLTLWALHRTVDDSSRRWAVLAGMFFALQVLSCIYYGVFLGMLLAGIVPLLWLTSGGRARRAIAPLGLAALVAAVAIIPYLLPYMGASRELGDRDMRDVVLYSARPANYLASPAISLLWGWTAERWGGNETRLFPGLVVLALSAAAFLNPRRRWVFIYATAAVLAIMLSFGINTTPYRWLFDHVSLLRGLRASARFAMLASAMLAVMAAFGAQWIAARTRLKGAAVPALLALMTLDGLNRPFELDAEPLTAPAGVYQFVRASGPGVVLELPLPTLDRLPGFDAYYSLWSMQHWFPLINGYSGYYPHDYVQTMVTMEAFPDDESIALLKAHAVRYVVVHKAFLGDDRYSSLLLRIASRPEFAPSGSFKDAFSDAAVFLVEP
jgi:hypothetical protein